MKSMEDFQQVEQDARALLSHAEGVLATGLTSIGTPDGVVIDQLRRSLIERTRDLHTLNKKFREFHAVGADPGAYIKLWFSS